MVIEGPLAPWAAGMEERLSELGYAAGHDEEPLGVGGEAQPFSGEAGSSGRRCHAGGAGAVLFVAWAWRTVRTDTEDVRVADRVPSRRRRRAAGGVGAAPIGDGRADLALPPVRVGRARLGARHRGELRPPADPVLDRARGSFARGARCGGREQVHDRPEPAVEPAEPGAVGHQPPVVLRFRDGGRADRHTVGQCGPVGGALERCRASSGARPGAGRSVARQL